MPTETEAPTNDRSRAGLSKAQLCWMLIPPGVCSLAALVVWASGTNRPVFLALNGALNSLGDVFWSSVTTLGDALVAIPFLVLFYRRKPTVIAVALVAALVTVPIVHSLKPLTNIDRPPAEYELDEYHLIGPDYMATAFPSGHTATAFAAAGTLALAGSSLMWARAALLVCATLIGLSRVAVGVHWPLDIMVGATIGWSGAAVGFWVAGLMRWYRRPFAKKATGAILILLAFGATFFHEVLYADAWAMQRAVSAACLAWAVVEFVLVLRETRTEPVGEL